MCTCACAYSLTDGAVFVQHLCQVLAMSADELKEHAEKEGWSDAESDDADDSSSPLSFGLYLSLGSFSVAWMLCPRCVCFIPGVYVLSQSQMCLLCTRCVCFVPVPSVCFVPGVFALSQVCMLCASPRCMLCPRHVCFAPGVFALSQACMLCPRCVGFVPVPGVYALPQISLLCPSPRCVCLVPGVYSSSQSHVYLLCPSMLCPRRVCFAPGVYALSQVCMLSPRYVWFVPGGNLSAWDIWVSGPEEQQQPQSCATQPS